MCLSSWLSNRPILNIIFTIDQRPGKINLKSKWTILSRLEPNYITHVPLTHLAYHHKRQHKVIKLIEIFAIQFPRKCMWGRRHKINKQWIVRNLKPASTHSVRSPNGSVSHGKFWKCIQIEQYPIACAILMTKRMLAKHELSKI